MPRLTAVRWIFALALAILVLMTGPSSAQVEIDLALVLAVDVSYSMDPEEQELQRQGYVEAFRSPLIHAAIRNGMLGRIAVTYFDWAGWTDQRVVVPWTVIEGAEDAMAFAERLAGASIRRASRTSISGAIDFSQGLLATGSFRATRRVIDVSGDGSNNQGRFVTQARDDALSKGITINGLPIMLKKPEPWEIAKIDTYYRDCVIGGVGAFMLPIRDRLEFLEAIKTKIMREIAGGPEPILLFQYAQGETVTDCRIGEDPSGGRGGSGN
jgi:hypothetical protein